MRVRTAIVGGGIMGTAIAMHLAPELGARARSVLLLERKTLGAGSSGRSGAILRCHYADREVARMARDSLAEYAAFEARTGKPIGFERCGVLTIAGPASRSSPASTEWQGRIRANVAMMQELGIRTRVVDAREISELCPGARVAPGTIAGWEPDGGFVDPERAVAAFGALARERGADLREGDGVVEIELDRSKRAVGLRTASGETHATEQIVLVAGPWTRGLLEALGVELPLRAVRPENGFLRTPGSAADAPRSAHPVLIDLEHGFYARCDPTRGRTRTGHVDYGHDALLEDPDALDETVGEASRGELRGMLARRLPVYAEAPDAGAIAAWYTLTPDAQALIGPVPGIGGLFVVSGFSGHGFKLAPSVGRGVAEMLLGRPPSAFDAAFFAPGRFGGREVQAWGGRFGL
jgi:glycine/D-amino acid oxidase-like deaminating enzyme